MSSPVSLRMTTHLNAFAHAPTDPARVAAAVVGPDVAHHVVDADGLLGLDPLRAVPLADALPALLHGRSAWVLALPVPGALGSLRGPADLNRAALEAGEAVLATDGSIALVPYRVGPAVQWRVFAAARPTTPPTPYEAERRLGEAILAAARTLSDLDVGRGNRPREPEPVALAPGYQARQQLAADRASRLLTACDAALAEDGGALTAYEVDARFRQLKTVRDAAADALCAAVSWLRP